MHSPFIIPLAAFAMVVLIVAITQVSCVRDKETDVARRMQLEEMEHRRRMEELDQKLMQLRQTQ